MRENALSGEMDESRRSTETPGGPRRRSAVRDVVGGIRDFDAITLSAGAVGALLVLLALVGPWLAPHPIGEIVGRSYLGPSASAPLGTDFLGRDVLSRVLSGGRTLVLVSVAATAAATIVGAALGLLAAFLRGFVDNTIMRGVDVLLTVPHILVLLVLAAAYGGGPLILVIVVMLTQAPLLVRIIRADTLQIVHRPFVEAAVARGERTRYILFKELLPNVRGTALAFSGLLFVSAVYISASASFLGIGAAPPASDWGRMIQENFDGAQSQPWGVIVPALLLVVLAAAVNVAADGIQRRYTGGAKRRRWFRASQAPLAPTSIGIEADGA